MILRRIDPLSLAKVFGLLYAFIGAVLGALFSLLALVGTFAAASQGKDEAFAFLFGVGAIVILPIFYGVLGVIGGFITAFFYNLAARFVGGVVLELEAKPSA